MTFKRHGRGTLLGSFPGAWVWQRLRREAGGQHDSRLSVCTAPTAPDGRERQVCRCLCQDGDPDDLLLDSLCRLVS